MKLKNKNAISLIVLVITILVLAILATTVIFSLSNTNIISEAGSAVKKTEAQQIEEAKTLMLADGKLGNNPEDMVIGDITLKWDEETKTVIEVRPNIVKEGVTIPFGFYYVGGTKDSGLVISDNAEDEDKGVDYTCVGNQFVWVPVEYTATGVIDANGLDTGFTDVFKRGTAVETSSGSGIYKMTGGVSSDFTEPYARGYSTESSEYNAMCASVQKYGGFYIARFEAGDGDVTDARTAVTDAHTVVSKKGAFVYNYVIWGKSMSSIAPYTYKNVANVAGAVYLSQNMYKNHESVVSTLCYGVQWDATMNFVSDAEHNIRDSRSWGNYEDSTGDAATNSGYTKMDFTTGRNEAWKAKNIYDLAGNVMEWVMEATSSIGRVSRGGAFHNSGSYYPASIRSKDYSSPYYAGGSVGFRPTLYIKVIE